MVRSTQVPSPRRPRAGISLLGVLTTLCAVALAALVAIPAFFGRHEVTLDNACKLLVKDLRSAQNRAAFLKTEALFAFDENGWVASDRTGGPLSRRSEPDRIERRFAENGVFEGVRVVRIAFGDDRAFVFDDRGLALEGGEVELAFRGETRIVRVEAASGHATVVSGNRVVLTERRPVTDAPADPLGTGAGRGAP